MFFKKNSVKLMTLYTLVLPSNLLHQKIIIKLPNFNSYNTVIILQIAAISFSIVSSIQFYHTRARALAPV